MKAKMKHPNHMEQRALVDMTEPFTDIFLQVNENLFLFNNLFYSFDIFYLLFCFDFFKPLILSKPPNFYLISLINKFLQIIFDTVFTFVCFIRANTT